MATWGKSEKSWERQPNESVQAYAAFDLYCRMGSDRSLRKVADELGKSCALIERWNRNWEWQRRSRDYDNELKRIELVEKRKAIRKMEERQLKTAVLLQQKAVKALDKLSIESLEPRDILRFITEGMKLERQMQYEATTKAATEAGDESVTGSLADTIVSAWKKRTEEEGSKDDKR